MFFFVVLIGFNNIFNSSLRLSASFDTLQSDLETLNSAYLKHCDSLRRKRCTKTPRTNQLNQPMKSQQKQQKHPKHFRKYAWEKKKKKHLKNFRLLTVKHCETVKPIRNWTIIHKATRHSRDRPNASTQRVKSTRNGYDYGPETTSGKRKQNPSICGFVGRTILLKQNQPDQQPNQSSK